MVSLKSREDFSVVNNELFYSCVIMSISRWCVLIDELMKTLDKAQTYTVNRSVKGRLNNAVIRKIYFLPRNSFMYPISLSAV